MAFRRHWLCPPIFLLTIANRDLDSCSGFSHTAVRQTCVDSSNNQHQSVLQIEKIAAPSFFEIRISELIRISFQGLRDHSNLWSACDSAALHLSVESKSSAQIKEQTPHNRSEAFKKPRFKAVPKSSKIKQTHTDQDSQ